uniref:Globin n=1 Tax=Tritia mutabilis TaxID=1934731 RepID=GLB_TRIMF|nr:RecName: Full=Globin; AltName: Full=Myoglobin [Tritia mutabilis]AAB25743.1 myoglobin [Tritia mutabilis]prf//1911210A myoglobin [Tritia mutabilis]
GLSAEQKTALKDSWKILAANGETMVKNSAAMFGLLFEKYPDTKKHFKTFDGDHFAAMKATGMGKAHGMSVFSGLGALVSSVDDGECVLGLAKKLSRNHTARGVTANDFKLMRSIFGEFLDKATGGKATESMKSAWDALLGVLIENHQ